MDVTIACSTLCFSNSSLEGAIASAGRLGFKSIDLAMLERWVHLWPSQLTVDYDACLQRVRSAAELAAVRVIAINASLTHAPSEMRGRSERLAETRALCALARDLAARVITVQPGPRAAEEDYPSAVAAAAQSLREMVSIAAESGVHLAFEPHEGGLCEQPERALELVGLVPECGITFDPSHFVAAEIDMQRCLPLFRHVRHAHLRDALPGKLHVSWKQGAVPINWCLDNLARVGYRGVISIESIGVEDRPEEVVAIRDHLTEAGCVLH